MMYLLFVVMILQNGTRIDMHYPDTFRYSECMTFARQEMQAMKLEDTSRFKTIDFYCGTQEDFDEEYPKPLQ